MDLQDACRLCLNKHEEGDNLFHCHEEEVPLSQIIENVFNIKLIEKPNYSSRACLSCIEKLDEAMQLKQKIDLSQEKLIQIELDHCLQVQVKVEPMDFSESSSESESSSPLNDIDEVFPKQEEQNDPIGTETSPEIPQPDDPVPDTGHLYECKTCNKTYSCNYFWKHHKCHAKPKPKPKPNPPKLDKIHTQPDLEEEFKRRDLLKCHECGAISQCFKSHMKHYRNVHRLKGYSRCCNRKFPLKDGLSHMKYHLDNDAFKCTICDKKLLSQRLLTHHNRFNCVAAPLSLRKPPEELSFDQPEPDQEVLENELRERNLLTCRICAVPSESFKELMLHIRSVHKQKGFGFCCDKMFTEFSLLEHIRYHLNDDTYKCVDCDSDKVYSTLGTLRKHRLVCLPSNKKRPEIKELSLDQPEPDQEVLENELKERNLLTCHFCEHPTESYKDLMMHVRSVHKQKGFAICCNEKFHHSNLLEHMRYHLNDDTYKCGGCYRVCRTVEGFRKHKLKCYSVNIKRLAKKEELEQEMRNRNLLVCPICAWSERDSLEQLMDHMKDEHSETGYILCCNVKFDSVTVFQHIQFHLNEDLHKCDECGKRLASEIALEAHCRRHQEKKRLFSCETCGKKVTTPTSLRNHQKTHLAQRELKFICEICGRGFDIKNQLDSHTLIHKERKTEQCTICGKHYLNIKNHIKSQHSNKKKEKCEVCGLETTALSQHMRSHNVEPSFFCQHVSCGKAFRSGHKLKEHMDTHLGVRIKCNYCDHTVSQSSNLAAHMRLKHPAEHEENLANKYATPRTLKGK